VNIATAVAGFQSRIRRFGRVIGLNSLRERLRLGALAPTIEALVALYSSAA
jgi:hypothetical protein